jgi:hypothetical protein
MSTTPTPRTSFSLRDLPLPAKLVITCFLLAVGGGYTSAMVQLHFQDSKSGEPMPTVHDVVLKFTGKKWFETNPPKPVSKLETLILADEGLTFSGNGTMSPAFFSRDGGSFNRACGASESERKRVRAERESERNALALWANAPSEIREQAYRDDHFDPEPTNKPSTITPEFKCTGDAIKVKSIIDTRCVRCHSKDGVDSKASPYPLETYGQISKYLVVQPTVTVKEGGDWVKVEEPIGLEKLTQSTHAHLLSFAMLFSLTGLVVAFSSYPMVVRCVLGSWVVLAVVADVSLWWLARLCPEWGPYFAMGVIGTGGAAGAGLAAQIVLSLWNMYGMKGRVVLAFLFLLGGACGWLVYLNQIQPGLDKKQNMLNAKANPEKKPEEAKPGTETQANKIHEKNDPPVTAKKDAVIAPVGISPMEKVFRFPVKDASGKELPLLQIPFIKVGDSTIPDGGMVRAFFDKDGGEFSKALKKNDMQAQEKLRPERFGEMEALVAWTRLADTERRKSYEADAFSLPSTLAGKPFTDDYLAAGKVKVKTLINDRCVRCHSAGADAEKYPFESYDQILQELVPRK